MPGHFVVSRKWNNPAIHVQYESDGIQIKLDAKALIGALARALDEEGIVRALDGDAVLRKAMLGDISHPLLLLTKRRQDRAIARALITFTIGHASFERALLKHFESVVEEMKAATIHQPPR